MTDDKRLHEKYVVFEEISFLILVIIALKDFEHFQINTKKKKKTYFLIRNWKKNS